MVILNFTTDKNAERRCSDADNIYSVCARPKVRYPSQVFQGVSLLLQRILLSFASTHQCHILGFQLYLSCKQRESAKETGLHRKDPRSHLQC